MKIPGGAKSAGKQGWSWTFPVSGARKGRLNTAQVGAKGNFPAAALGWRGNLGGSSQEEVLLWVLWLQPQPGCAWVGFRWNLRAFSRCQHLRGGNNAIPAWIPASCLAGFRPAR